MWFLYFRFLLIISFCTLTVHSEILYFAESLQCIACLVHACCNLNVWIVFPSFFKLSRSRCDQMQPALPEPACACKPLGSWAPSYTLLYMPSYVGTLLYIPSYALLYIPTYTPSYPYPLMYVYLFYWLAKSLGTLLYIPSYTVLCMCRFCLLANPWAAYYFIYPSLTWGSSYYCRCIYVY